MAHLSATTPAQTVKRALLRGPRDLVFEDIELDFGALGDAEIAAETEVSAVSLGTELAAYAGHPPLRPGRPYPRKLGYCNVARVHRVGAAVRELAEGMRVLTHQSHQGGFICSKEEVLATVPPEVTSERASLSYLAVLGLNALHRVGYRTGETVAVVGLGAIGLATIALAHSIGAPVVGIGNHPERTALATDLGAEGVVHADDPSPDKTAANLLGGPVDVVVLTASSWSAWKVARELPRGHGRVAMLGFPGRVEGAPDFNPLDSAYLYDKQLSIVTAGEVVLHEHGPFDAASVLRQNVRYVLHSMKRDRLPLERLINVRERWEALARIYERSMVEKSTVGAVLQWRC